MSLGAEATAAGALLDNAGLAPSSAGALVQLTGGHLTAVDGPFAEAKEFISYALYQVRSKEEAVQWASRFMQLHLDLWPGWEGRVHRAQGLRARGLRPTGLTGHNGPRLATSVPPVRRNVPVRTTIPGSPQRSRFATSVVASPQRPHVVASHRAL